MLHTVLIHNNVSANQSFKLSDLEWYHATKFIARIFINITVFKDVCSLDNPRIVRKDDFERGK